MILKETKFWISDNSGAVKAKCIHVYANQSSQIGNFVKSVLYLFDTKKKLAKKKKYYSLILSTKKKHIRLDGATIAFSENRGLLTADREKMLGSRIYGPIANELKKKLSDQQFKKYKSISSGVV